MDALQKLGIDGWSVVLYALNTFLLIAVLTKLLYKPILKFLDERRETIRRNLTEVETLRKTFEEETRKQDAASKEAAKQLRQELAAMKAEAETKAQAVLAQATQERDALLDKARAEVDAAKARILQDAEQDIQSRIERVVMHVLQTKLPQETVHTSVQSAWKDLATK